MLFGVTVITFMMHVRGAGRPGADAGRQERRRSASRRSRSSLGLDQPLYVQYGKFICRLLHGDLGESYYSGVTVAD